MYKLWRDDGLTWSEMMDLVPLEDQHLFCMAANSCDLENHLSVGNRKLFKSIIEHIIALFLVFILILILLT